MITFTSFLFVVAAMAQAALIATFVILERDTQRRYSMVLSGYRKRKHSRQKSVHDHRP